MQAIRFLALLGGGARGWRLQLLGQVLQRLSQILVVVIFVEHGRKDRTQIRLDILECLQGLVVGVVGVLDRRLTVGMLRMRIQEG